MKKKTALIIATTPLLLFGLFFNSCNKQDEAPPIRPTITSIDPDNGSPGTEIKINGTAFGANSEKVSVTINGVPAVVKSVSNTLIVVIIPEDAGTGEVKVTVNGTTITGPTLTFRYRLAIKSVHPLEGTAGTLVTIVGKGFSLKAAEDLVTFNGKNAIIKSAKPDTLQVEVPFQAGDGVVGLVVGNQLVTGPFFHFIAPTGLTITTVNPAIGVTNTQVTIFGTQFKADANQNIVKFNGVAAAVSTATPLQLAVSVPSGCTSGPVTVEVAGQRVTGPVFTVFGISQLNPVAGAPGTVVTIDGDAFSETPSGNTVLFNGVAATVTAASTRQLVVVVPLGATTGVVSIKVGNLVASGPSFTVSPSSISGIVPSRGFPETDVDINGQGFDTHKAPVVKFNGVVADLKKLTSTKITATVPVNASTGYVTVEYGTVLMSGPVFTVIQTNLAAIQPTSGPTGTTVTINGTGINDDIGQATLSFNGVQATIVSISETQIVATVPSGATTGNISLKYGKREIYGPVFTVQPVSLTSVSPNTGNAGTAVTLTGTGFDPLLINTRVTFNGVAATIASATATEMVVNVPAGASTGDLVLAVNGFQINAGVFTVTTNIGVSTVADKLKASPVGVTIGQGGDLFVTLGARNSVVRIDATHNVTPYAGDNGAKLIDGPLSSAAFNTPNGIAADNAAGKLYVADAKNNMIRVVDNTTVSTLAGDGTGGNINGAGINARFNFPTGITMGPDGNLYVTDYYNHQVRKVTPGGEVTTIAGGGSAGFQDGMGTSALFNGPFGITADRAGNVYVCDSQNNRVRKITPSGDVTTVANVTHPMGIAVDPSGVPLYVCTTGSRIYEVSTGSAVTICGAGSGNADGTLSQAKFDIPVCLVLDADGNLYVADSNNKSIRKVTLH